MKRRVLAGAILLGCPCLGQSARDYYNELYAAGGLDRVLSEHVCFDERPELQTFFIFTSTKVIREAMIANGSFGRAPRSFQAQLSKDMPIFRGYDKGVALSSEDDFVSDNNGSYLTEKFLIDTTPAQIRFNINWNTMRYKRAVEILNPNGSVQASVPAYGRCESISSAVKQRGH